MQECCDYIWALWYILCCSPWLRQWIPVNCLSELKGEGWSGVKKSPVSSDVMAHLKSREGSMNHILWEWAPVKIIPLVSCSIQWGPGSLESKTGNDMAIGRDWDFRHSSLKIPSKPWNVSIGLMTLKWVSSDLFFLLNESRIADLFHFEIHRALWVINVFWRCERFVYINGFCQHSGKIGQYA